MVRDELPPAAAVMLATLSPGIAVRQPFTTDRAAVISAVNALPLSLGGQLTLAEVVEKVEYACDRGGTEGLQKTAVAVARSLVTESRQRLASAARRSRSTPSIRAGWSPPTCRRSIAAAPECHAEAQKVLAIDQTRSQQYLQAVAASTGGRTFLNTNDLAAGLRRAWLDASEYYLIGYTPSGSRKKGQFHRIEVKVARAGLDVRYGRGYYEATEQELARKDVETAFREPWSFPYEGFDVEARVEDGKLWVTTFIPPTAIRFSDEGGAKKADFSVHGTLRDEKGQLVGGKPVIGRDLGVKLNPDRVAELLASGSKLEIRTDVDPPKPGKYQIVVVARDSGGWIAARTVDVTIPQ